MIRYTLKRLGEALIARLVVSLLIFLSIRVAPVAAQEPAELLYFYIDGCPACTRAGAFLDELAAEHPRLSVERYDVAADGLDEEGRELFDSLVERHEAVGVVPTIVLGEQLWSGFNGTIRAQILSAVERNHRLEAAAGSVRLPLLGEVSLQDASALGATMLIALVDGFNPCSLWVLTFLLGVVVHTRSRPKTVAVGLTFLVVTAAIYGLFIAGVFGLFLLGRAGHAVRYLVAALALAFGAINIKDYFALGRGVSLTVTDAQKRRIGERLRGLMAVSGSTPLLLASTAALAAGVTFIELPCTAGFPVVWATLMSENGTTGVAFGLLLAVYLLVYLGDELLVLTAAVTALKRAAFEERHGRLLKLLGGTLMASLGTALLATPEAGRSLGGVLAVFAAACAITAVVHLVRRRAGGT